MKRFLSLVAVMVLVMPTFTHAAFATVETTSSGNEDSNQTSHSITMPSGIVAGDLLVIIFGTRANTTTSLSGWTELADANYVHIYTKVAVGGDTATISSGSSRSAHVVYRISGDNGADSANVSATVGAQAGASTTPDPPSHTPAWSADDTLWIALTVFDNDGDTTTVDGIPASYTDEVSKDDNNGAVSTHIGTARRENATGTEDPGTFTIANSKVSTSATLAIRPEQPVTGGNAMLMSSGL